MMQAGAGDKIVPVGTGRGAGLVKGVVPNRQWRRPIEKLDPDQQKSRGGASDDSRYEEEPGDVGGVTRLVGVF